MKPLLCIFVIFFIIGATRLEAAGIFTGLFKDYKVDLDADGKADELDIDVELNVPASDDKYLVRCFLVNQDDYNSQKQDYTFQNYSRYNLNLKQGKQTITLHFDGYKIFKDKMNGPYALTGLYFGRYLSSTPKDVYEDLDEKPVVYITTPYKYTEFEEPDLSFQGDEATFILKTGQTAKIVEGDIGTEEVKLLLVRAQSVQIALGSMPEPNEFKLNIGEDASFVMGGLEQTGTLQLLEINGDAAKFKIKFGSAPAAPEISKDMPIDIIYSK